MVAYTGKELLIRADGNGAMGTGHVLRCLALAQGWLGRGGEVTFLGAIENPALVQRIRDEGCGFEERADVYPDPADLKFMVERVALGQWLVVDGYQFTAAYTKSLRQVGARLVVIDDYNHLPKYNTDLLLNQNHGSKQYKYAMNGGATLLCGSRYVLLRREFLTCQAEQKEKKSGVHHLLVTLGGGDQNKIIGRVIHALAGLKGVSLRVKIVVGGAHPHGRSVQEALTECSSPCEILQNVENMASLMVWADLAVTAGGTTCWELAYMGVPALVIIVADNQQEIARQLATYGAGVNMGWSHLFSDGELGETIADLLADGPRRKRMEAKALALVDGCGVERCIDKMEVV